MKDARRAKKEVMIASCPVCGKKLFRGAISDIEIRCSGCNNDLKVELNGERVSVAKYVIERTDSMVAEPEATYGTT